MNDEDSTLDRLFDAMAQQGASAELPAERARRRERAIGGMRALQLRLSRQQPTPSGQRRVWVGAGVAAALVAAGAAFAATAGVWSRPRPVEPRVVVAPSTSPVATTSGRQPEHDEATRLAPVEAPAIPMVPTSKGKAINPRGAELEEVNRLFAEAKRARREHRDAEALAMLQRLLTRYPGSVLSHEAGVERFRALSRLGRYAEAQRHAKAYLLAYPHGYAVDEARRLVGADEGP